MSEEFDIRQHIEIDAVIPDEPGGGYWVHSHGMAQFDKPDLEMVDVPGLFVEEAASIINHVAQYLAEGAQIDPGQTMDIGHMVPLLFLTGDSEHVGNACLRIVEADTARCAFHGRHN
jgi:hypothetical protein